MIDTFCWNVRGFNNSVRRRNFRKWFRLSKALFGSIIETKVKEHRSRKILHTSFPGWKSECNYEFAMLGRIWVVWNPAVEMTIVSKSDQAITCVVRLPHSPVEFAVTFVYAVNCRYGRRRLWLEIEQLAANSLVSDKPWLILGDFNQALDPTDASSGGSRVTRGMEEFRSCLLNSNISDLPFRGQHYTWWNNQEQNPLAKKIDRVLVNVNWLLSFPLSYGTFGSMEFSDHCPSCVNIGNQVGGKNKPFRLSNFLMFHAEFLETIRATWERLAYHGTAMFTLSKKLKYLKGTIRSFNREHYSGLEKRVAQAALHLKACQSDLLASPSTHLARLEKEAHKVWADLALAEERFLCQRSRIQWLQCGDCNSAFFHRMMAERRSLNEIHYLIDQTGRKIENLDELQSHCVNFFKDLFGATSHSLEQEQVDHIRSLTRFRCDSSMQQQLEAQVSEAEIKAEFFALPSNKSPGPDGYTSEFFRKTWSIVGPSLIEAVQEFFTSGRILSQWNSTSVTLVPKKQNADKLTDFRPISCCNGIYKVISKILARRLEQILPQWISPSQSAFVQGRLLTENVLLATELVQGFGQQSVSSRGVLKVDLRKAFDSVDWNFILEVLKAANLPHRFVSWIKQCITTPSFSINVNGSLCGYFKGSKGLRQGDPLSPSLFVIAMEILARLLESNFSDGSIGFHPKASEVKISSLAFADDLMIFYDGKPSSLQGINSVLSSFKTLSGLEMNTEKSAVYTAGLDDTESEETRAFGFVNGTFPFRYLGLPLLHRKLRRSDYSPLIDKVASRFNHWATKTLSFAGRLQLISSVIYSTVNFWLSSFILPKCCLKTIEQMCNRFLWNNDIEKKGGAKVSWTVVCLPKNEGGLGLRNFWTWNKTLNLRLIWMLFARRNSLWVAWNHATRLQNANFWNVEAANHHSWIWKSLLALRPLAKRFLRSDVGDGQEISYWYDHWNNLGPLIAYVGNTRPMLTGIPDNAVVAVGSSSTGWILPSPRTRNPALAAIRNSLMSINAPSSNRGPDSYRWYIEGSSTTTFSSKLTWEALRPVSPPQRWAKAVWYKGCIPKHAFTFWVAHLNRLPTRERTVRWSANAPSLCCICGSVTETRAHLFFQCTFSSTIWKLALHRFGRAQLFQDWPEMIDWISTGSGPFSLTLKRLVTQTVIYHIWKERNSRLHTSDTEPPTSVFSLIDRSVRDSILARPNRNKFKNLLSQWFTFE